MEAKVYNSKGKESGKIKLPETVFGLPLKTDLVHQVVHSILSNARRPIAHAKGRSEVRGGGAKPWRQKGTGRARHGSSRSPIWTGGGVTHGPSKERNFSKKVNRKMRKRALFSLLSEKNRRGEILFVDNLEFGEPKAKEAKDVLNHLSGVKGFENLSSKRKNSAIVALGQKDVNTEKSFNNFGNVRVLESRNLNAANLVNYKYLVFVGPEASIEAISGEKASSKKEEKKETKTTKKDSKK